MSDLRTGRTKRGTFVLNIVQTLTGYSLVQGTQLLNKTQSQSNFPQPSSVISNTGGTISLKDNIQLPIKQMRVGTKRTNIMMLKSNQQQANTKKSSEIDHKTTSTQSCKYAQWFNINNVHEKQQAMVIQWINQINSEKVQQIRDSPQLRNLINQYRRYRDQIIKIYYEEYASQKKYLTSTQVRKHICADAYWLMRIHTFLSSWGIINGYHINFQHEVNQQQYLLKLNTKTGKYTMLDYQLNLNENILSHHINEQDQNQVLKKITWKVRPYCDYCGIHCGIVWFQHLRVIDSKQISMIMKNVNSKNPPLSNRQYEIVLCTRCYCDGHFPLLLTHHDFKKVSVNDKLEPNKRKKHKKKKDKNKKKRKQRQRQQQYQDERDIQSQHQKSPEKEQQIQKPQINVDTIIKTILEAQHSQKKWSTKQTLKFLGLVEQYGEKWDTIHKEMQKNGYCVDTTCQQMIQFFLNLPQKGISRIREQYRNEEFLKDNYHCNTTNLIDLIEQNTLNKIIKMKQTQKTSDEKTALVDKKQCQQIKTPQWKEALNQFIKLYMKKTLTSIQTLEQLQNISKEKMRITAQLHKNVKLKNI